MDRAVRRLAVGSALIASALLACGVAKAEAFGLELNRLEYRSRHSRDGDRTLLFRRVYPQFFHMDRDRVRGGKDAPVFSDLVTKEPSEYESEHPFRAVAKLGGGRYAFVLDSTDLKSKGYDQLYFDRNRNGDLTDEKVLQAMPIPEGIDFPAGYMSREFPRVDITVNADAAKVGYSFFLYVSSRIEGKSFRYASARLMSAAYREGDVLVGGKKHCVVLLDFNSNGRFDDEFKIDENIRMPDGQIYPTPGDMLLVDPDLNDRSYSGYYNVTGRKELQYVSKLIALDERFYEIEITPAGDRITLTSSKLPVGVVTNPNDCYSAVVYSDKGLVKISGEKSRPVPLPQGDWKLLSYTIDLTERRGKPSTRPAAKKRSLLERLSSLFSGSGESDGQDLPPRPTSVSAMGTRDYHAVKVGEGRTALLPFGPPYKPVVTASTRRGGQEARLELKIVGCAGEICTDLMVNGQRPEEPSFVIATNDGEIVERGRFEYG